MSKETLQNMVQSSALINILINISSYYITSITLLVVYRICASDIFSGKHIIWNNP